MVTIKITQSYSKKIHDILVTHSYRLVELKPFQAYMILSMFLSVGVNSDVRHACYIVVN